jgi:hypothetical protein
MLYRGIIAVFSEINTKYINTVWAECTFVEFELVVHDVTCRLWNVKSRFALCCLHREIAGSISVHGLFVCYDLLLICWFCGQKRYVLSSEQEKTNNPQCERSIRCLQISSVLEIMRDNKEFDWLPKFNFMLSLTSFFTIMCAVGLNLLVPAYKRMEENNSSVVGI